MSIMHFNGDVSPEYKARSAPSRKSSLLSDAFGTYMAADMHDFLQHYGTRRTPESKVKDCEMDES